MAEATTLLAYLVPRLTNRVEDAATDSLAFILNKSAPCRRALDRLLQDGDFSPDDGKLRAVQGLTDAPVVSSIPQAFRDVIDELDFPPPDGESHH